MTRWTQLVAGGCGIFLAISNGHATAQGLASSAHQASLQEIDRLKRDVPRAVFHDGDEF